MTTTAITPLRQRMIEDMNARKLCAGTQRGHIRACKRFAGFLKRSPDTASLEDIRRLQLHLADTGVSICTRNCIMTGLRFLFRVTLRRLDLAEEVYHAVAIKELEMLAHTLDEDADFVVRAMGEQGSGAAVLVVYRRDSDVPPSRGLRTVGYHLALVRHATGPADGRRPLWPRRRPSRTRAERIWSGSSWRRGNGDKANANYCLHALDRRNFTAPGLNLSPKRAIRTVCRGRQRF
jgi:hypothetical protein